MRRVRVEEVRAGAIELEEAEAHHARDVLRMEAGERVEVFDAQGRAGAGKIESVGKKVVVRVERVEERRGGFEWWVGAAIPKGTRGDWMVEKLSELGASGFVPLITARSVVHPEGKNKLARWERLASEAAKQSKRRGVMKIGEVMEVGKLVSHLRVGEFRTQNSEFRRRPSPPPSPGVPGEGAGAVWYLSVGEGARKMSEVVAEMAGKKMAKLVMLIGPEGGWTDEEIAMFGEAGLTGVRMGASILRVETAAVAAAAIVAGMVAPLME